MTTAIPGGFQFTPATGLSDTSAYPTTPANEAAARQQFMDLFYQILNEINAPTTSAGANSQNRLFNSNFDVWEKGVSFNPSTTVPTYTANRWTTDAALAGTNYTISRQDGSGISGSRYCLRYTRTAAATNVNNRAIRQGIETANTIMLRGKKATASFYARCGANYSPTSSILNVLIQTGTGADESPVGYTGVAMIATLAATLTTSWQKYSVTSSAVVASSVNEMNVTIYDTPVGTAGANDYFEITQVQINSGDIALPYQPKSYQDEEASVQRYNQRMGGSAYTVFGVGEAISTTRAYVFIPLLKKMRIVPTLTSSVAAAYRLLANNTSILATSLGVDTTQSTTDRICVVVDVAAGLTLGQVVLFTASADSTAFINLDAEL